MLDKTPKREPREHAISFRIALSLKKALDQAAFDERRSMSQLIEIWLDEKAREKGYLK
jgi:hypothetical protein